MDNQKSIKKQKLENHQKNNKYDENNGKNVAKTQNLQNVKIRGLQKTFFPVS